MIWKNKKNKYGKTVCIGRIRAEFIKKKSRYEIKLLYHTHCYKFIIYLFDYMLKWMQIKHDLWSFVQNYRIP